MSMKVKIEIELENGDLNTLIKTFATLFSKLDISQLTPKEPTKPEYQYNTNTMYDKCTDDVSTVNPGDLTSNEIHNMVQDTEEALVYDDGSGNKTVLESEKKNEEFQV